jgi:hypothetical protein
MLGPVIEGDRVRLIPATEEMLETFVKWMSDADVTRFLGRREPPSLVQARLRERYAGVLGHRAGRAHHRDQRHP